VEVKDNRKQYGSIQPTPYPYLVSAMDKYYGVSNSYKKDKTIKTNNEISKKKQKRKNKSSKQNKKMRILIATFWDYPNIGGLQNYITTLKAGLEDFGHSVDIIAPNHFSKEVTGRLRREFTEYFKQFYIKRYGHYSEKIVYNDCNLYIYEMMLKDMNLEQYDIFHAQDRFTANALGRLNRLYQKPLFFTPHGFMTHSKLKFNLIKKGSLEEVYFLSIDKQAIESCSHMVILCEAFRPILKKIGAEDSKMTTVYTGIEFWAENNKQTDIKVKDRTVITCISRLGPRKGHKYLLEALALFKNQFKNVDVRIVGDGPMRDDLEKQARDLQLDNVSFLGSRNDISELLSESDIFVMPTTSDTLPLSIIEAMFAEKAILTTNCGGIPEIIKDYHSGLITDPANSEYLGVKLLLLLHDVSLRTKLAKKAKAFAEKHLTVSNMAKKIEEIYQSVI
jgi:glycosyltransferase involved in cell wall biosynthesis